MISQVTSGVKVSVQVTYREQRSSPENHEYFFSYHIHIENHNSYAIQLLRRKWIITNGFGEIEIVEGEGVVGKQPLLYPGDNYEYISSAGIDTPFGVMKGLYYFQNIQTDEEFIVKVPEFKLETLELLN
jgi:ApaG protein